MRFFRKLLRCRRGATLVEYGLLLAGVSLVSAAAISILGRKTNELVAVVAAVLPGVQATDNGTITSGRLLETVDATSTVDIELDLEAINDAQATSRLAVNLGLSATELAELVDAP